MSSVWAALRKDAGAHRCSARGLRLDDLRGLQSRCRPRDAQWGGGPCSTWSRPEAERSGPAWSFWKGLLERLWRTPRAELRLGLSRRMGTRQCLFALSPNAMGGGRGRGRLVCLMGPDLWKASGSSGRGGWRDPRSPQQSGSWAFPVCHAAPQSSGRGRSSPGGRRKAWGEDRGLHAPPTATSLPAGNEDSVGRPGPSASPLRTSKARCTHGLWAGCTRRRKGHLLSTRGWPSPLPLPCCCPRVASAETPRRGEDATQLPCPTQRSGRSPGSGFWFQQTGGGTVNRSLVPGRFCRAHSRRKALGASVLITDNLSQVPQLLALPVFHLGT